MADKFQNLIDAALAKVKKQVDPKQYEMFEVYVVKNWPVRKIARELGVSAGQVYVAKHRISRLVEKEIQHLEAKLI